MTPTSHFIGLKVRTEPLADLFVALQEVLGHDGAIAEFQNNLSVHVTLYYLPADTRADHVRLMNIINGINNETPVLRIGGFAYFGEVNTPRLCYLAPTNETFVRTQNEFLEKEFPEFMDIPDNAYRPYVPHLTLFNIYDARAFMQKKSEVEAIITREIAKIHQENLFESVSLFCVNSRFRPEMQIAVVL